ncbi:MAG: glycine cleavage T C-terminal barrel domain-containing protein [Woeseiaceae bacterium]|nr:glycine cleavage T C-terminal barrel domain-containing protein [Woeseiaceae bacterium]
MLPVDGTRHAPEGTQLTEPGRTTQPPPVPMLGYVTSSYWSPALGSHFCLALVDDGRRRHGDIVHAALAGGAVEMTIRSPVFFDPDNERRDG